MENQSQATLLEAIRAIEIMFSCNVCCHDFSGQIIALLGKDNLPMEHYNDICRGVKGYDNNYFYKCINCDVKACHQMVNEHQYFLKKCHAGLCELVLPVMRFNMPIGIIFAGPFIWAEDADSLLLHYIQPESSIAAPETVADIAKLPELDNGKLRLLLPLMRLITDKLNTMVEGELLPKKSSRKERIRFFLKQKHMNPVNEDDLALFLELSVTRVSQLLSEYFGKSFSTLLNETRLEFAENALINSSTPIEKIADLSGFGTTAYFYRLFKNKYKMTPTEFRKQQISPQK